MERLQEIATRKAELKALLESEEKQDLEAIEKELNDLEMEEKSINEKVEAEQKKINEEIEERKADAEAINEGEVSPVEIKELKKEENKMEIRNTQEYIDAFARYIKSNDSTEVRTLLSENGNGTVATPDFVYDIVKTAWEKENLMALVNKVELKGNLKVNFEISGDGAIVHKEGGEAVTEEALSLGIATLTPVSIKKWIGISDEVMDLRGEAFLRYIYNELAYQIAKKCADELVKIIVALPETATATTPSAKAIEQNPAVGTIATAIANLSDEATEPVVIMNKATYAKFKEVQYGAGYSVDVFEGLNVVFNNSLPTFENASAGDVYAIVGDLRNGAMANFPNGANNIEFKFDDKTLMTQDIIRIMGREYVGLNVVACGHFCLLKKKTV
jgi:HK97 family phage major capsid protein